jgi:uncharacterized protein (TIGR01777 family)
MKILITGATGLVGLELSKELKRLGHELVLLTRNAVNASKTLAPYGEVVQWNYETDNMLELCQKVEGVIHLMGENVGECRWTEENKKSMTDSRVIPLQKMVEALTSTNKRLKFFMSANAIGIYGNRKEEEITETSSVKNEDFLSNLCSQWQKEAEKVSSFADRYTILRIGVVLSKQGGALKKMLLPFQLNLGGRIGDGEQFMSWIHWKDLVSLIATTVEDSRYSGIINATSPNPVTNKEWTTILAKQLNRFAVFPVPEFAIKLLFGEMSTVVLTGQKVLPAKATSLGFKFKFPTLKEAFKDLI